MSEEITTLTIWLFINSVLKYKYERRRSKILKRVMEECSDSDWVLSGNTVPVCHETCFSTLPFNRINNIFKCYEYYITTRNLNRHVLDVFVFVTMTLVLLFSLVCIEKPDVRLTDFVSTTTIVSLSH